MKITLNYAFVSNACHCIVLSVPYEQIHFFAFLVALMNHFGHIMTQFYHL